MPVSVCFPGCKISKKKECLRNPAQGQRRRKHAQLSLGSINSGSGITGVGISLDLVSDAARRVCGCVLDGSESFKRRAEDYIYERYMAERPLHLHLGWRVMDEIPSVGAKERTRVDLTGRADGSGHELLAAGCMVF